MATKKSSKLKFSDNISTTVNFHTNHTRKSSNDNDEDYFDRFGNLMFLNQDTQLQDDSGIKYSNYMHYLTGAHNVSGNEINDMENNNSIEAYLCVSVLFTTFGISMCDEGFEYIKNLIYTHIIIIREFELYKSFQISIVYLNNSDRIDKFYMTSRVFDIFDMIRIYRSEFRRVNAIITSISIVRIGIVDILFHYATNPDGSQSSRFTNMTYEPKTIDHTLIGYHNDCIKGSHLPLQHINRLMSEPYNRLKLLYQWYCDGFDPQAFDYLKDAYF
jgi:hypothetical protein